MNKFREKLAETRKKFDDVIAWHESNAAILEPVYQKAIDIGGDVATTDTYGNITLSGDKHKLAEMVRALRGAGFRTTESPPKKDQTSWSPTYYHDNLTSGWVWLFFTSSVCRRVKVGTRVVPERTEDVYETVCGEVEIDRSAEQTEPNEMPF